MTTTDADFTRAFAERVRQQLETHRRTALEGGPAVSTKTDAQTANAHVPATFQAASDAQCEAYPWCVETGQHLDHNGREVELPFGEGMAPILGAYLYADKGAPDLVYTPGSDDCLEFTSGDQLRQQTAKVRAHLVRLDALADQFDAIREGETGQPAEASDAVAKAFAEGAFTYTLPVAPRTWTIATDLGASVSGYLPSWADRDPSRTDTPSDRLELRLDDIWHQRYFDGLTVHMDAPGFEGRAVGEYEILRGSIDCQPYSANPAHRVPTVSVDVVEDHHIPNLDPDGVADLAAKLRQQADHLDRVREQLIAARADWAVNGGTR